MIRLLPVYIVIFIGFVGYSLMITVFTPMILNTETYMISPQSSPSSRIIFLGILLFIYPFGQFFGSPILGSLSDYYGRKRILIISLIITTLGYALIATSLTIENLPLLMLSLFVAGVCEGNIVIAQSSIADCVSKQERNRFFGYISLSASSAYILGPLMGGKLAQHTPATPFWALFALLIFTTIWIFFKFIEPRTITTPQPKMDYLSTFTNLKTVFTDRRLRILYFTNFLFYLAIFGFFRCYPMYMVDVFHMDVSTESEYIAWVSVPIIVANLGLTGILSSKYSLKTMTITSALLTGIFMIVIIIPDQPQYLWLTLFLAAITLAITLPSCATLLSVSANSDEQGRVMGNNQALQVGAEAISGLLGGIAAAILIELSLIVPGIIAIIAAIILFKAKTAPIQDN